MGSKMWKRTICQNQQGRPKPTDERNGVFWQIVVVTIIVEWRQQEAGSGFFSPENATRREGIYPCDNK